MARHVPRNALVLWLSEQHLNRPCNSREASRGDEGNRQAEMANPTKCRDIDSLQCPRTNVLLITKELLRIQLCTAVREDHYDNLHVTTRCLRDHA
jgi:hypothetical protein